MLYLQLQSLFDHTWSSTAIFLTHFMSVLYDYKGISLNSLLLALGANPSLTAAVVVLTGLVGANFVQAMLDRLGLFDPIARGIATASRYVHKIHSFFLLFE